MSLDKSLSLFRRFFICRMDLIPPYCMAKEGKSYTTLFKKQEKQIKKKEIITGGTRILRCRNAKNSLNKTFQRPFPEEQTFKKKKIKKEERQKQKNKKDNLSVFCLWEKEKIAQEVLNIFL